MGCGWGHPDQRNRSRNRERLSFTLKATAEELTRPEGKSLQRHDGLSSTVATLQALPLRHWLVFSFAAAPGGAARLAKGTTSRLGGGGDRFMLPAVQLEHSERSRACPVGRVKKTRKGRKS